MRTSEITLAKTAGFAIPPLLNGIPAPATTSSRHARSSVRERDSSKLPASAPIARRLDKAENRVAEITLHCASRALDTPILRSLLPLAAGFCSNAEARIEQPATGRYEAAILYCIKGEGWCELRGRRYRLQAGDVCIIPGETARIYGTDTGRPWKFAWIHAAGSNLGFFLDQLGVTIERPILKPGQDSRLLGWFLELLDLLGPTCAQPELLYASQTLAHLLGALVCCRRHQRSETDTDVSRKIERSIDYMRQHLHEPLRAGRLAAVANMSLPHYFALFKRIIGATPIDYFIKLRMEQARRLLSETAWSVKEVASSLGYEDPLYFSRVFKAVNHATPTGFRVNHSVK